MSDIKRKIKRIIQNIKKNYDMFQTCLITIISTFLYEVLESIYNFILNIKATNGDTLEEAFPKLKPGVLFCFIILYLILFYFVIIVANWIKNKLFNTSNEEKYMKDTFLRLKEFGSKRQGCFRNDSISMAHGFKYTEFLITTHIKSIDLVVSTCLEFFKDAFSAQGDLVNEISFEVSFMSKSYIDDKITIVSSDNNKHRTPPSMLKRSSEPNIYDSTETGKLYERYIANPSETLAIHIVEDCSTQAEFTALYEGEIDIIKSMAILPILSPQNELLGTLVVCVNQNNFFKNQDRHFWNELLEIYSVELGYHYLALRYCIRHNCNILADSFKKPF